MTTFVLDPPPSKAHVQVMSPREVKAFVRRVVPFLSKVTFWSAFPRSSYSDLESANFWLGSVSWRRSENDTTFGLSLIPQLRERFVDFEDFAKQLVQAEVPSWCEQQRSPPPSFSHDGNQLNLAFRGSMRGAESTSSERHATGWTRPRLVARR